MLLRKYFKTSWMILLIPMQLMGQSSPVRQAEKKMLQGNWAGAHQVLIKALKKDSVNVQAELSLSRWFLDDNNPSRQTDSAYDHNVQALHDFIKATSRQREKLKRERIDSTSIVRLRERIDSVAFESAKEINTEKSYHAFVQKFKYAKERIAAIELRDEVAFVNALRQNSYSAFEGYLKQYPASKRAKEARDRYEKLLFEAKTKDKKFESYVSFVKEFPLSPYKPVADKNIFELETISGIPEDFVKFMDDHPGNYYVNRARDFLYYLTLDDVRKVSSSMLTDSLMKIMEMNRLLWAPVYKNGRYGFINTRGVETFAPQFESIKEEYKCGSIKDDILVTSSGLISRSGIRLTDKTSVVAELGYGFLKVGDSSCVKVLHKSGAWIIEDCVQDATVVNGFFLAIKVNGLFGLYALTGRMLLQAQWSAIDMKEGVVILDQMGKKTLCLPSQLALLADGNPFSENFVFDQVKPLGGGLLLVTNGALEGIMNSKLQFVVPLARQSLYQLPFGLVRKINDQFVFRGLAPELENTSWSSYQFYRQWLLLKNAQGRRLLDLHAKRIVENNPDSLWVANGLVFASSGDSIRIHVNSASRISVSPNARLAFVQSTDSIRYFFVEQKSRKAVFSIDTGEKLFVADCDHIESVTAAIFVITRKNKKGLINKQGKVMLPMEYDALVLTNKNHLSLFKDKKFGLYHLSSHKLIKPSFERNLSEINNETLIAFKGGHMGLIDWDAKALTPFEYDEIVPWSENVIWAKKGFEWSLMDFQNHKEVLSHIKSFHVFSSQSDEKLAMVKQENYFGILSSKRGMIIPPSFSLITNLGDEDEPLYFTAKEVEEAGIVVVIYYDKNGALLRKQVYEDEEFARIVCPED